MNDEFKGKVLTNLAESIDIPDSAYEAARNRYHDLGGWLSDQSKAKSAQYKPHIAPQGSFRLGTVTKPWKRDDYDLDLHCKLQEGIKKWSHSQEQLKELLGADLSAYRTERGITEGLERKHRCWRVNYQDRLKFHIDSVPCIPETEQTRRALQQRMIQAGTSGLLARDVADLAVAITDDREKSYGQISEDWLISNPEGYAKWFESRMKLGDSFLRSRIIEAKVARVEDLPIYQWKTPLQTAIQILKRHRDVMFERKPDGKPISIIITTLAAQAYSGEFDLSTALEQILAKMAVNPRKPNVPNPVNPVEDFADKWGTPEGRRLRLEENFFVWLEQARSDIYKITSSFDKEELKQHLRDNFGTALEENVLSAIIGSFSRITVAPAVHVIRNDAPKPWCR